MEGMIKIMEEMISKQAVMETFVYILLCVAPIWLAIMIGLFIGWSWRPRWTSLLFLGIRSKFRLVWTASLDFGAHRLWVAFTALSAFSMGHKLWFIFRRKDSSPRPPSSSSDQASAHTVVGGSSDDISENDVAENNIVVEKDLEHLLHLLDGKDGQMAWQTIMQHSTPKLVYQAWRHEPERGPTVYRSKTIFEDATPEDVRDFFWDDEFRPKWDSMLAYFKILEECPHDGTMIVHWIKKLPLFCTEREYFIGRRIWESGNAFFCVTKGVPYPALVSGDKRIRVNLYFSSWVIKPVQSLKGGEQLSACEVTLVHYEDMGIPKDIAKLGVWHGMWGTVKKLHSGFRAYQNARMSDASLSRCAELARITTKISSNEDTDSLETEHGQDDKTEKLHIQNKGGNGKIDWRWVAIGGAVLVCGFHSGVIGKALLLGAGRRAAARRGKF